MVIGSLAFSVAKSIGSSYLAKKVANGEMSFNTGANISSAIGLGKSIIAGYMTATTIDSAIKGSKEYWKPQYK